MPLPAASRIPPELPPEDRLPDVDQVAIRKLGGFNFLEPEQWQSIDRNERMQMIKAGTVTFLSQGEDVPLRDALQSLQEAFGESRAGEAERAANLRAPGDQVNFDVGTPRPREA
jgi:hypothetical protein